MRPALFAPLLLIAAASPIVAPPGAPFARAADTAVSSDAVAEAYAALLERDYVFPETGKRYAAAIRAGIAAGRYAPLSGQALADALAQDVRAVSPDGHIRITAPAPAPAGGAAPSAPRPATPSIEQPGWIAPGVAYIRFNRFPNDEGKTAAVVARFMADHADARAIIFDLRIHRGGGREQMDVIIPWLFDRPTPLLDMAMRESVDRAMGGNGDDGPAYRVTRGAPGTVTRTHWALPNADPRLKKAKVYLLTSTVTASAAEHFSLAMKRTRRAMLVGTATGGANHFGMMMPVAGGYEAFIPFGRTYDPDTGQDWEGGGVQPDVAVSAAEALLWALTDLGIAPEEAKRLSDAHVPSVPMERARARPASGG